MAGAVCGGGGEGGGVGSGCNCGGGSDPCNGSSKWGIGCGG